MLSPATARLCCYIVAASLICTDQHMCVSAAADKLVPSPAPACAHESNCCCCCAVVFSCAASGTFRDQVSWMYMHVTRRCNGTGFGAVAFTSVS
jgi:hypothetical protein